MKHLFNKWKEISSNIKDAQHILLASDYDGTLAPIAREPSLTVLSKKAKAVIRSISSHPFFTTAIVSGRSLADITKKVGIRNIYYFGNYGLEIKSPRLKFNLPEAKKYKLLMLLVREDLEQKLKRIKGVVIEDKRLSFSVHYRQVSEKGIKKLKDIFYNTLDPFIQDKKIVIYSGKKVLVAQPLIRVNKGKVFFWMIKNLSVVYCDTLPIYLGDDETDESAFTVVNKKEGLSIFVGKRKIKSNAKYYLESPEEVTEFLKQIRKIVSKNNRIQSGGLT